MRGIISRFAPAPTGFLHLGHVANAVYVWRETRARHGRVLLRIEDHDRQRSRRHFEEAILEDLAWLGFEADEPLVRQSERGAIYEFALDGLRRRGLVDACHCSRTHVAQAGLNAAQAFRPAIAGLKPRATPEAPDATPELRLARLLGRAEPLEFLHHGLIMKPAASSGGLVGPGAASAAGGGPRQKLSKSDGDTGIRELRAQGWTPRQVIELSMSMIAG